MADLRLHKAVVFKRLAHICKRLVQFGGGKAGTGIQLAGAVQLRVDRGAFCSVHADIADEAARRSAEDEFDAVLKRLTLYLDGFKEAGGKQLAQAFLQILNFERRAFGLGKVSGKRVKPRGVNALKRDSPDRQSLPFADGTGHGVECLLLRLGGGDGNRGCARTRFLAPGAGNAGAGRDEDGGEQNS
jgi:hypothetical protein